MNIAWCHQVPVFVFKEGGAVGINVLQEFSGCEVKEFIVLAGTIQLRLHTRTKLSDDSTRRAVCSVVFSVECGRLTTCESSINL